MGKKPCRQCSVAMCFFFTTTRDELNKRFVLVRAFNLCYRQWRVNRRQRLIETDGCVGWHQTHINRRKQVQNIRTSDTHKICHHNRHHLGRIVWADWWTSSFCMWRVVLCEPVVKHLNLSWWRSAPHTHANLHLHKHRCRFASDTPTDRTRFVLASSCLWFKCHLHMSLYCTRKRVIQLQRCARASAPMNANNAMEGWLHDCLLHWLRHNDLYNCNHTDL